MPSTCTEGPYIKLWLHRLNSLLFLKPQMLNRTEHSPLLISNKKVSFKIKFNRLNRMLNTEKHLIQLIQIISIMVHLMKKTNDQMKWNLNISIKLIRKGKIWALTSTKLHYLEHKDSFQEQQCKHALSQGSHWIQKMRTEIIKTSLYSN